MPGKPRADLWSVADLARVAGVDDRTVRRWREDGLPTRLVDGQPRFAPEDAWAWRERWHAQRLKDAQAERRPAGDTNALARKAEAEARLLELRLARETGEVVPLADFSRALGKALDLVMARLRALPSYLAELGPEVEHVADREVERIITEMHHMDEDVIEEEPDAPAAQEDDE